MTTSKSNEADAKISLEKKVAFITVGTTEFDQLIEAIDNNDFLTCLRRNGFSQLKVQIGRGTYKPRLLGRDGDGDRDIDIVTTVFRFKDDLADEISSSDMIISHCGAGTILETVTLGKKLLVVVNTSLQGNHQSELADALVGGGYCPATYPSTTKLIENIEKLMESDSDVVERKKTQKLFPINNPDLFSSVLDSYL